MDVFIYFLDSTSLPLDGIEDALDDAFVGSGEVTGSGAGERGSNIDIEIMDDCMTTKEVKATIRECFERLGIVGPTKVVIDGVIHMIE